MKIVLAGVAGFALGYFVCKKQLEEKYIRIANEEAAAATQFYKQRAASSGEMDVDAERVEREKEQGKLEDAVSYAEADVAETFTHYEKMVVEPPIEMSPELKAAVSEYQTGVLTPVPHPVPAVPKPGPPKPASSGYELNPFIIDVDTFLQGESNYEQYTLTYYAGDDVLAGSNDQAIEGKDRRRTIGSDEVLSFGEQSNDPNVVYIRNHLLKMDLEIAKSDGKFSEEVLGL